MAARSDVRITPETVELRVGAPLQLRVNGAAYGTQGETTWFFDDQPIIGQSGNTFRRDAPARRHASRDARATQRARLCSPPWQAALRCNSERKRRRTRPACRVSARVRLASAAMRRRRAARARGSAPGLQMALADRC
jgi:hypothetical protein